MRGAPGSRPLDTRWVKKRGFTPWLRFGGPRPTEDGAESDAEYVARVDYEDEAKEQAGLKELEEKEKREGRRPGGV